MSAAHHICQLCLDEPLERFEACNQVVLWRCPKCDLYQDGTLYTPEQYDGEYDNMYGPRLRKKVYTAAMRLNRVVPLLQTKQPRLLDVGCNLGATMDAARRRGWAVVGADVSADAIRHCRQRGFECELFDGDTLPFPDASFDLVTAWHVIEHVRDVRPALIEWRRVLKPGGVLALETPDSSSPKVKRRGPRYGGRFWRPEHTYTFCPRNLSRFCEQVRLKVIEQPFIGPVTAMPFFTACYSVGHRLIDGALQAVGNYKAFQLAARRES